MAKFSAIPSIDPDKISLGSRRLVIGMMDENNKKGCPHKEWVDDIIEWCGASLQDVIHSATGGRW